MAKLTKVQNPFTGQSINLTNFGQLGQIILGVAVISILFGMGSFVAGILREWLSRVPGIGPAASAQASPSPYQNL